MTHHSLDSLRPQSAFFPPTDLNTSCWGSSSKSNCRRPQTSSLPVRLPKASTLAQQRVRSKSQPRNDLVIEGSNAGIPMTMMAMSFLPSATLAPSPAAQPQQQPQPQPQSQQQQPREVRNRDNAAQERRERMKNKQTISRLEQEAADLRQKLEAARRESDQLRSDVALLQDRVAELETGAKRDEAAAATREARYSAELTVAQERLLAAEKEASGLQAALDDQRSRRSEVESRLQSELAELRASAQSSADLAHNKDARLEQFQLNHRAEARSLQGKVDEQRLKILTLQKELLALHNESRSGAPPTPQLLDCQNFIKRVCQPQFSVVQDESLTPVAADCGFGMVEGHVLVPLKLLLEGYAMLPRELRETHVRDPDYAPPGPREGSRRYSHQQTPLQES
eukprot:NODE_1310_length_1592_cov_47.289047_g1175_i0.p1 GENE.NODE_1310_length_1592_cov_47.289047_g1175_i0~~NODE_1310_length_1592_cov_47.289047_g1175_i0.p1  ORF type:complete len:396 (-),score=76.90 NODE_1310_length_1592_cov_47.289047_g1175_i0:291-1478(-)